MIREEKLECEGDICFFDNIEKFALASFNK